MDRCMNELIVHERWMVDDGWCMNELMTGAKKRAKEWMNQEK